MKQFTFIMVFIALCTLCGCASTVSPTQRTIPSDPAFDAIYERFGNPDRFSGSGRAFLHYYLENGQEITLTVSGGSIIGAEVSVK